MDGFVLVVEEEVDDDADRVAGGTTKFDPRLDTDVGKLNVDASTYEGDWTRPLSAVEMGGNEGAASSARKGCFNSSSAEGRRSGLRWRHRDTKSTPSGPSSSGIFGGSVACATRSRERKRGRERVRGEQTGLK